MPEAYEDVMWTYSAAESGAITTLYYMGMSFLLVYLTVMLLVPVFSSFRLF